jgi:endonuclease YncB( thermonuclease family)
MGCCFSLYDYTKKIKQLKQLKQSSISNCTYFTFDHQTLTTKIVDVYDGDTCTAAIWIKDNIVLFKLRLAHIDTPELKDEMNKFKSIRARNALIQFVTQNKNIDLHKEYTKKDIQSLCEQSTCILEVKCGPFDKYGRLLGELFHSSSPTSINQQFIQLGYANPYEGKTKQRFE